MRNIVLGILLILIMAISGCGSSKENHDSVSATTESSIAEAEWTMDNDSIENNDESAWNTACSAVESDLLGIEWITDVSFTPERYEDYVALGDITITCKVQEGRDITEEDTESIKKYIDATQFFENYELCVE